MYIVTWIIIAIIAIYLIVLTISTRALYPERKGNKGERAVLKKLGDTIPSQQYVINDVLFQTNNNSCQIDHVYINKYGIWVIETKNYLGYIYGGENQREWTQVTAYGRNMRKFYNPVKQNNTHIYHLSQYLGVNYIFNNAVIFVGNVDISNVKSDKVYYIEEIDLIKNRMTDINLSIEEMETYYDKIMELKDNSTITPMQHIANINKKQADLERGICPRCGGTLMLRNGRNGQFYGCSNYPKCKFTKNIE